MYPLVRFEVDINMSMHIFHMSTNLVCILLVVAGYCTNEEHMAIAVLAERTMYSIWHGQSTLNMNH